MAGIQTSKITTAGNGDLTLDPGGGKTKVKSVDANNPGVTPVASASDGTLKKLVITELATKTTLDSADWVLIHDSATGQTKKVTGDEGIRRFGNTQTPFADPLPETGAPWEIATGTLAVRANGNGSTADLKNSVEFAVGNNTYNQNNKNVNTNQTVKVRWMDSKLVAANHGQIISGELYSLDGRFNQIWNFTIIKQPTSWSIPPKFDQPVSSEITSDVTIPTGMNAPSPVTIGSGTLTNVKFSINGGAYGTTGNILSGQTLQVKGTTGPNTETEYTIDISIGGLVQTWRVTTEGNNIILVSPNVLVPLNGSTVEGNSNVVYQSTNPNSINPTGTDVLTSSQWEIRYGSNLAGSKVLVSSTPIVEDGSGNSYRVRVSIPSGVVGEFVFSRVRYNWRDSGTTDWSNISTGSYHTVEIIAQSNPKPPTGPKCYACSGSPVNSLRSFPKVTDATTTIHSPLPHKRGTPIDFEYEYPDDPKKGVTAQLTRDDGVRSFGGRSPICAGCGGPCSSPWRNTWPTEACNSPGTGGNWSGRFRGIIGGGQPGPCDRESWGDVFFAVEDCSFVASAVGTVTGDTAGTASPGTLLKFQGLEIDGRPAWTTEYKYSIISYKFVPDDGSAGDCGGTEVTINSEFETGQKAFKWPANANEIDSSALTTSKVTEIKIGVQLVWSDQVEEVTTIYATGCP